MLVKKIYKETLTEHIVMEDVIRYEVAANGQRGHYTEGIAVFKGWRALKVQNNFRNE